MRFFSNVNEALHEVQRDLVEMGINVWPKSMQNKDVSKDQNYQTKEIIGYGFRVMNARTDEALEAAAKFHQLPIEQVQRYCFAEMGDRLYEKPLNPGTSYKLRPEVWDEFLNKKGKFDYTYSERINLTLQFLLDTLKRDVASRQAVLSIWRPLDIANSGGVSRIPCSLHYQFIIRPENDKLVMNVIYTMRSCDIYTHFGFDVAMAIMLGHAVREMLPYPIRAVHLTMNIGSLHAYRKDYEPRGVF
jgi:thymidylate synthase